MHIQLLTQANDKNLTEVINSISSSYKFHYMGKPSESGAYVLYYFRQENCLSMKYFLKSLDMEKEIADDIIFIDDNTLTGDEDSQAYIFFNSIKIRITKITFKEVLFVLVYSYYVLIGSHKAFAYLKTFDTNNLFIVLLK